MLDNLWRVSCAEADVGEPLAEDAEVDLAIVGGGFTGCAAALDATERGASVCLLEASTIGHGGSGRNVGLVNAGLWLPPNAVAKQMGEAAATRLLDVLMEAPARVFELVERHRIACEPRCDGTLHCAHAAPALADLERRQRQGNRLGAALRLLDAAEVAARTGTTRFHGGLFDPRAGTVQPLAYCRGLARAARDAGARVHVRSPASRILRHGGRWRLECGDRRVTATALLLATNAYHEGLDAVLEPAYVPVHYSQFATAPLPRASLERILPAGEGCWDTATVMSSFRLDAAGRLIVGGIGDARGAGGAVHRAWARRFLGSLYPEVAGVAFEHAWSGRIAMTGDHLPKIVAFGPAALACFGYSGRGIAPGTCFGALASQALLGGETSVLPLEPTSRHRERSRALRATGFELGATLVHGIEAARLRLGV